MDKIINADRIATIRNANHDLAAEEMDPMEATGKSYWDGEAMWHEATGSGHAYGWITLGHEKLRAPGERTFAVAAFSEIKDWEGQ